MHDTELEPLARQLAEGLRGDHDAFCRELVRLTARVESYCPVSGTEVSLSVTPTGIHDLTTADAVVSIVIPGQGSSFCNQSRFFRSKRDALMWQGAHLDARILCVEDAYRLGKLVARYRYEDRPSMSARRNSGPLLPGVPGSQKERGTANWMDQHEREAARPRNKSATACLTRDRGV